jgi:hypothetical protein
MARNPNRHEPRPLRDEDVSDWFGAADKRMAEPPIPRGKVAVLRHIKKRNPIKFWRLQRDYKWLGKELKRIGLNPDDAWRYL